MVSKVSTGLSVFVVLISMPFYYFREALFSAFVPVWMWYYFLPSGRVSCPTIDADYFRSKSIRTPTMEVRDYSECLEQGARMGHPLICRGIAIPQEKIVNAIVNDPKKYEYFCYDKICSKSIVLNCREVSKIGDSNADPSMLMTLKEVMETKGKNCYAGPIIDNSQNERLRDIFEHLDDNIPSFQDNKEQTRKVEQGGSLNFPTSFVGSFERGNIYTSDHAANVDSMVYQVKGRKVFLMYDHVETKHWTLYSKILHPWPECTADYLKDHKAMWIAPLQPGDYLYFPPYWSHIVYSDKGVNIMTNIRKVTMNRVLYGGTYANAAGVIATAAMGKEPWSKDYNEFLRHAYDVFDDENSTDIIRNILEEYL